MQENRLTFNNLALFCVMSMKPKFSLGRQVMTANARRQLDPLSVMASIARHQRGDWGDCCSEDQKTNNQALNKGGRLFSVYHDTNGTKFWIITEADRSVTTVLLPEDY